MGYRSQEFFSTTRSGYNRLMEFVAEESYSRIAWDVDIPHLYITTDWSYE